MILPVIALWTRVLVLGDHAACVTCLRRQAVAQKTHFREAGKMLPQLLVSLQLFQEFLKGRRSPMSGYLELVAWCTSAKSTLLRTTSDVFVALHKFPPRVSFVGAAPNLKIL